MEEQATTKRRVLVVDDSPSVVAYLRTVLSADRFDLESVASAEEAREYLKGRPCDLMLLDLELPGMHGMDYLAELRASGSQLVIVILTSKGSIAVALEAVRRGADGFIQKQDAYAGEIEHLLERAEDHRQSLLLKEQLHQLRSDFYAAITHDLRSPIGSAQSALALLEEGVGSEAERSEMLRIIRSALDRAMNLIDRYLDYERIDEGFLQIRPRQVDLIQVVESIMHDLRIQALGRRQTLAFVPGHATLDAFVDPERLGQVVQNLVSNALRYTGEGGRIEVRVAKLGSEIVIEVSDNGVGIPPAEQGRIFEKFYRSSTGGRTQGTGLGLLIVHEIVTAHRGRVSVESSGVPGEGSRFTVRLPAEPPR